MPIIKDTPVVIPAKAEKTLPHTWISQMTIDAKNTSNGYLFIQLVPYDFLDYYPKALANIQIAINDRNAKSLENEATSLYGALVYFPYYEILERVIILQKMGKLANFDAAEKNLNLLNSELGQLAQGLESFLSEEKVA